MKNRNLNFDTNAVVYLDPDRLPVHLVEVGDRGPFARATTAVAGGVSPTSDIPVEVIHHGVRFNAHIDSASVDGLIGREDGDSEVPQPAACSAILRRGATIYTAPSLTKGAAIKQWAVLTMARDAKALVSEFVSPWRIVQLADPDPDILMIRGYVRETDLAPTTGNGACGSDVVPRQ